LTQQFLFAAVKYRLCASFEKCQWNPSVEIRQSARECEINADDIDPILRLQIKKISDIYRLCFKTKCSSVL